jgi:glutamate-1-semialdehyde 2,1-aminomutase
MTAATVGPATQQSLLGGISSAFRINPFTGTYLSVRAVHGATIETTDGRSYIDMFLAHGSTVLGHAHPAVVEAVRKSLENGVVIGYETPLGERVARRLTGALPSAEAVRFVASGSEAVATAMRVRRGPFRRRAGSRAPSPRRSSPCHGTTCRPSLPRWRPITTGWRP